MGRLQQAIYSVLVLCTKGAANRFLVRFAGRPDPRHQPDGQAALEAMGEKHINSSMQQRRILMPKNLNGMIVGPNQDPDDYLTGVFQQRDELEHICVSFAEVRTLDILLDGLTDEYEPI